MVLIATFAGIIAVGYAAVLALLAWTIRAARECPACSADTIPVRRRWPRPLARRFEWRWCPSCGWQAIARAAPQTPGADRTDF